MARKTFTKKSGAKRKAHGRSVYKVKKGWRIGCGRKRRRRR
jgi:hypothetical protein